MAPANPQLIGQIVAGIIGFVSGVAILLIAQLLKNRGKIIVNVNSCSINMFKQDGQGGQQPADSLTESDRVDCSFEVDFFNSSDVPKSLRATTIEFIPRNTKKSHPLTIYLPRKVNSPSITYTSIMPIEMHILNLPSKETVRLKLHGDFTREDVEFLQGKVDFYFRGEYPSGKVFRKILIMKEF